MSLCAIQAEVIPRHQSAGHMSTQTWIASAIQTVPMLYKAHHRKQGHGMTQLTAIVFPLSMMQA